MHDIKWIRENPEILDEAMLKRNLESIATKIVELDEEKRRIVTLIQKLQQARKEKANAIAKMANKTSKEFEYLKRDANDIKEKIAELENKLSKDSELEEYLSGLPNILDERVPEGKEEADNQEISKWGEIPEFKFKPKQHFDLGEDLGYMDFVQAAKISGSRFAILSGPLAKLSRALANFMLEVATEKFGCLEVEPPLLVKDNAMFGSGQLPKFAEDSFETTNGYRLIPTSEVSLANIVADKIVDAKELPMRFVAHTPCFRSEAGSAGKDTRGLIRQHQFYKVELVTICEPGQSEEEHKRMLGSAEEILKLLKIPYKVMVLCSGDTGFCAQMTYDIEAWMPGQNQYREISSCSNCGSFQARRMKARFRDVPGSKNIDFVHTLNGSALAVGRTLIAVMENYQNEDGSINIPAVLQKYMGGMEKIHCYRNIVR
jgi:seryl-tRNA synthetase